MNHIERPDSISHYKILDTLGRGGMGIVYLAEDSRLKRKVAIKSLYKHQQTEALIQRLRYEAKVLAKLNHPNVVHIYHVIDQDGDFALVMEYVEGRSFNDYLKENRLSLRQKLVLLIQILDGLAAAHSQGIIHRDLKLDNILVDAQGCAKLSDFGIAKDHSIKALELTKHNVVSGSLSAMSPEQIRGDKLTPPSDMFSFGIAAWQILKACHPFQAENDLLKAEKILNTAAPSLACANLPAGLTDYLDLCLEKNPDKRPHNIPRMVEALKLYAKQLDDEVVEHKSITDKALSEKFVWRKLLASCVAIFLLVFLLFSFFQGSKVKSETSYVAVLPTKKVFKDSLNYQFFVKATRDALNDGVIRANNTYLISEQDILPYRDSLEAIFINLGADLLIQNELECEKLICELKLKSIRKNFHEESSLVHLVDDNPLQIYEIVQKDFLSLVKLPGSLLPLSEAIDDKAYREYVESRLANEAGELTTAETLFRLARLIESYPKFEPAVAHYTHLSLDSYYETQDEGIVNELKKTIKLAKSGSPKSLIILRLEAEFLIELSEFSAAQRVISDFYNSGGGERDREFLLGMLERAKENYSQSIKHFELAAQCREAPELYYNIALILWLQGKSIESMEKLQEAEDKYPGNLDISYFKAYVLTYMGSLDEAEEIYLKQIKVSPTSFVHANLGLVYMLKREYALAEEQLLISKSLSPEGDGWILNLADTFLLMGKTEEADKLYRKIISDRQAKGDVRDLIPRSQAFAHLGDLKSALREVREAKKIVPQSPDVAYTEALIFTKMKDYLSAIVAIEKSLEYGNDKIWFSMSWFDELCRDAEHGDKFKKLTGLKCDI